MSRSLRLVLAGFLISCGAGLFASASAVPDARYYRYDQIVAQFQIWQQQYPAIFHVERLGKTGVGQESIWGVRISDNAAVNEAEPVLLFHGAQHANEPNGTNAILFMMERLLTRYGQDPYYDAMVNGLQMWFVPIVNVDGHRLAFSEMPEALNWRKTKRDNNADGQYTCPEDGVDTNRNWDYRWTEDPASQPSDEYYKGPWPFSEPEVISLRSFILRYRPLLVLDYHSPYQQTMGNAIFWTWMETGGLPAPDEEFYHSVARDLMNRSQTEIDGHHYSGLPGFNTLPKEQNWIYANLQSCALIMEISRDNWWSGAMVDTIAARVGRGTFSLMERALSGPGLAGRVTDAFTGAPIQAEIRVSVAYYPQLGPFLTEPEFGSYWRFLNPGTYMVTALATGYFEQTVAVDVDAGTWSSLDFALVPNTTAVEGNSAPSSSEERILWTENPLGPGGWIHLRNATGEAGTLRLFDTTGRLVRTLESSRERESRTSGPSRLVWDGRDDGGAPLAAGVYHLRLTTPTRATTAKVTITR